MHEQENTPKSEIKITKESEEQENTSEAKVDISNVAGEQKETEVALHAETLEETGEKYEVHTFY
jgi:hypothetical protein